MPKPNNPVPTFEIIPVTQGCLTIKSSRALDKLTVTIYPDWGRKFDQARFTISSEVAGFPDRSHDVAEIDEVHFIAGEFITRCYAAQSFDGGFIEYVPSVEMIGIMYAVMAAVDEVEAYAHTDIAA